MKVGALPHPPAVHLGAVKPTSPGEKECGVAIEPATFAAASDSCNTDIVAIVSAQAAFRCPQDYMRYSNGGEIALVTFDF